MLNVGMGEFLVFLTFAIIILGPEKLPVVIQKSRHAYKKAKYLLESQVYDLEHQLETWQSSQEKPSYSYFYLDPIACYPYDPQFIQNLFLKRHRQLCNISLIHQLQNHALRLEIFALKNQKNRSEPNMNNKLKVVA